MTKRQIVELSDGLQKVSPRAIKYRDTIVAMFCGLLLLSNILAVKPILTGSFEHITNLGPLQIWPLVLDGGAILFPLTYILDDVITEIYGFKVARRTILTGFALEIIAIGMIMLVGILPTVPDWDNSEAFNAVLGFVPRIVIASLSAYLVGELLNAKALVKIREITGEKKLWMRLLGSTVVGELADTLTFCTIAFAGILTTAEFLNYVIVGYIFKCLLEVVLLPVTYRVISFLKH